MPLSSHLPFAPEVHILDSKIMGKLSFSRCSKCKSNFNIHNDSKNVAHKITGRNAGCSKCQGKEAKAKEPQIGAVQQRNYPSGVPARSMHDQGMLYEQEQHSMPQMERFSPGYPPVGGQRANAPQGMNLSHGRRQETHMNNYNGDRYSQADRYSPAYSYMGRDRSYSNHIPLRPLSTQSSQRDSDSNAHVYNVIESRGPRRRFELALELVPDCRRSTRRPSVSRSRDYYPPLQRNPEYRSSVGVPSIASGYGSRSVRGSAREPTVGGISRSHTVMEGGRYGLKDPRYTVAELP